MANENRTIIIGVNSRESFVFYFQVKIVMLLGDVRIRVIITS